MDIDLVLDSVHRLIHAKDEETITKYLKITKLTPFELGKVNNLREMAHLEKIVA